MTCDNHRTSSVRTVMAAGLLEETYVEWLRLLRRCYWTATVATSLTGASQVCHPARAGRYDEDAHLFLPVGQNRQF